MKHQLAGKATTAEPCRARQGTVPALSETQRGATRHPILQLQGTIGNQAVNRLLQSGRLQTKRTVSRPGDTPVQRQESDEEELLQSSGDTLQKKPGALAAPPAHHPNRTGLPDNLKSGIESLSGFSMDDVTVHYNSAQPARLNALAYTQGTEIHIAPGQEQHLPHEAWHVVQQAQRRVQPTMQLKDGVPVNDDQGLEQEAEVMGELAAASGSRMASQGARPDPISVQPPGRLNFLYTSPFRQLESKSPSQVQTRPVAGQGTVQRRLTVDKIDYNPVTGQYRHGIINQDAFFAAMTVEINSTSTYKIYSHQWNNVLGAVRTAANHQDGIRAADVPTLVKDIAQIVADEYRKRGLSAFDTLKEQFAADITKHVITNIVPDTGGGMVMTPEESSAYDRLRNIVGDNNMSRAKGTANSLPYDRLPQEVKGGVDAVLYDLRSERALWRDIGIGNLGIKYFLPPPNECFSFEILQRQRGKRYQGNHENNAGWLPAEAAPVNHVAKQQMKILNSATRSLAIALCGPEPLSTLGLAKGMAPTADGKLFLKGVIAARGRISNAQLVDSVGAALTQGVSGYVEFSMPGDISRLVYDAVNGHVYVSAHYKWRLGYNPWFKVTEAPKV